MCVCACTLSIWIRAEIWHVGGVCNHEIVEGPGEPVDGGGDNQ